jgi:hypothetical protein
MTKIFTNKSNIDLDYPICRPSLDLDFTQEVLDPRITFTRGTSGTRVNRNRLIETMSINTPRFDYDPVTGECKGLLIEEGRVNSWLYSGQNVTTGWGLVGGTLSFDNTITAPDATTNTVKFTESAIYTSGRRFSQTLSVTSGTSYTFSIFAKQPDNSPPRYFSILLFNTGFGEFKLATFNPTNGAVLYTTGTLTTSVQKYPNGWWRFSVTGTATATTTSGFDIRFTNSVTGSANPPYGFGGPYGNYIGDGYSSLYFYGPQVENGAFMTSFIPTDGTAGGKPRSADIASMTGTNFSSWYNQSEGTIFSSSRGIRATGARILWSISDGTFANSNYFATPESDGNIYISMITNGSSQIFLGTSPLISLVTNFLYKSAYVIKQNDRRLSINGSSVTFRIQSTPPIVNRFFIGSSWSGTGTYLNGTISRLTYYPRALKPNQLQTLTS